jgi:hydroxypyruvate isomerase
MMNRREFLQVSAGAAAPKVPAPKKARITSSVMLWTLKGAFEERVLAAARAGIQSVELVTEWIQWTGPQLLEKKRFVRSFGLGIDTILAQHDWTKRPVTMVDPAHREGFLEDVRNAITVSQKLEVPYIILMSGNAIAGRTYDEQFASIVEGGKRAAELASKAGVTLVFEPLNAKVDHKGYFLTSCGEGLKLVREIASPHFKLLFDLYHEQVQTGSVLPLAVDAVPHVAIYHVADAPGRNDPGTGVMKYPEIYKAISKASYSGYICMEYLPKGDAVESLKKSVDEMRANVQT